MNSKFMTDPRTYTIDEALKNLTAVEAHLKQIGSDRDFCMDCIEKHLYALWMLSDEGLQFFPDATEPWFELGEWCQRMLSKETLSVEEGLSASDKGRSIRKKLQSLRRQKNPLTQEKEEPILTSKQEAKKGEGIQCEILLKNPPPPESDLYSIYLECKNA